MRRDGNCFYRSFIYQIFEHIVAEQDTPMLEKLIKTAEASKEDLMVNAGYEEIVIGDFYDIFLEELNKLKEVAKEDAQKHCLELMSNHDQANYIIMYIRWLTALYLKKNAILFEAYIFEFGDIHSFC